MEQDRLLCGCKGVTEGMIRDLLEAGADTLTDIQYSTGAGRGCGTCSSKISSFLRREKQIKTFWQK